MSGRPKKPSVFPTSMVPRIEAVQDLIREAVLRDTGTSGSLLFLDSNKKISQDNSNLFWDATNARLGISITSPTGKLHVNQSSATGAIPSAHFEQDDVSEEMFRFTGQAAADVLTQTLVAGASVTTATKAGFIRVNVQDEGDVMTDGNYYLQVFTIA